MSSDIQGVRYLVKATTATDEVAKRFRRWILEEHGKDLLAVPGCFEFRLFEVGARQFHCEYLFESEQALAEYFDRHASGLRAKGRDLFPESELELSREEHRFLGGETAKS